MTRRTIGIMASVVGSALGAWWWTHRSKTSSSVAFQGARGTLMFDNTPSPNDVDAII